MSDQGNQNEPDDRDAAPPSDDRLEDGLDLVLLGNLLVDDIVLRDGTTLLGEPGGAVLHAALAARLWGLRVGVASVVGSDYPAAALEALADRGVDLTGVRSMQRTGGRAWLLHEPRLRRVIHHLDCPTHEEVSPAFAHLSPAYLAARAFHLAPMPLLRQRELAEALGQVGDRTPFVSLDPFELVRDHNLPLWSQVWRHVDAFFPSEDEWRVTGDPASILRDATEGRLRFLAMKHGDRGGRLHDFQRDIVTVSEGHVPVYWPARATQVVDVTGAGDAFVAGFLAGWLLHGDIVRGLEQGIVSASFAIEDWGARGLMSATPAAAEARRQVWFANERSSEAPRP